VGDGKLGLLLALTCQWHGLEVILLGKNEKKLALARTLGIANVQLAETWRLKFQVVIEASGASGGLQTALKIIEPPGDAGAEKHLSGSDHAGHFTLGGA
jgi:threonine dehydrogenase-like Zn-dependent dehydrogenase